MAKDHDAQSSLIITRTKVIGGAFLVVVIVLLLYIWGVNDKALDPFFKETNLNLLGDFLAGVFAPLAFIGLGAAFYLQHLQLKIALAENAKSEQRQLEQARLAERQERLNFAATQANYKLALYDKRLTVYNKLKDASRSLTMEGTDSHDVATNILDAIEEAEFVYDDEVKQWLERTKSLAFKAASSQRKVDRHIKAVSEGRINVDSAEQKNADLDEAYNLEQELHATLSIERLKLIFSPYLQLPMVIEPVDNGGNAETNRTEKSQRRVRRRSLGSFTHHSAA